jgi:hypothetical protein
MATHFDFRFDGRFQKLLSFIGASPQTSSVELTDDGYLDARFGKVQLRTQLDNISDAKLTGPYRWWRAIGVRTSLKDRGLTFGSALEGVCISFKEPVTAKPAFGRFRHPGLTVTVIDRSGLVDALAPSTKP